MPENPFAYFLGPLDVWTASQMWLSGAFENVLLYLRFSYKSKSFLIFALSAELRTLSNFLMLYLRSEWKVSGSQVPSSFFSLNEKIKGDWKLSFKKYLEASSQVYVHSLYILINHILKEQNYGNS